MYKQLENVYFVSYVFTLSCIFDRIQFSCGFENQFNWSVIDAECFQFKAGMWKILE